MFAPVSCTKCGKPFQVPEAALGQLAPCPWCGQAVTALPVAAPLPAAPPPAASQQTPKPEPLSLDDAPAVAPVPPPPRPKSRVATLVVGAVVMLAVTGATVLLLGYRAGRMPDADWAEFAPADGSFAAKLPGRPDESDVEPLPDGSLRAGKRYAVRRWYARTAAWVAYNDLEPGLAKKLTADPDRAVAAGVLRAARDREVARLQGTNVKERAEVREGDGWGAEVHMDTPDGPAAVRLVALGTGPHPRLYVFGVQGKHAGPDGAATRRLFGSFRVTD
jgi:hypothetical protein